jgi:RNase adaptor protein for sRNA GlmZ degradation
MTITLISFGYLHQPLGPDGGPLLPEADRVEDVRARFRDPARARIAGILDLDGRDERVQQVVLDTPGVQEFVDDLVAYALRPRVESLAVGCAGGKHRACTIIELVAGRLRELDHDVVVEHRHAHLPRVLHAS